MQPLVSNRCTSLSIWKFLETVEECTIAPTVRSSAVTNATLNASSSFVPLPVTTS